MRDAAVKANKIVGVEKRSGEAGLGKLVRMPRPVFGVNVADWGGVKANHFWQAVHEARPELTFKEAMVAAHPFWKIAPTTILCATAGEAHRLSSALTTAGASVSKD